MKILFEDIIKESIFKKQLHSFLFLTFTKKNFVVLMIH